MGRVSFTIPGRPHAKQRPRFVRATGRTFTPKETESFERVVGQYALEHFTAPLSGPVKLTVIATFQVARSWSKKKRAALMHGPHTQKPDLDNVVKGIKDGLNRIAWRDDSQVAEVDARKGWGETAQTVVTVEPILAVGELALEVVG